MKRSDVQLGQSIRREGKIWRVVRLVDNDFKLVQREDGTKYVLQSSYAQLRNEGGEISFITFEGGQITNYTGPESHIPGLDERWRV